MTYREIINEMLKLMNVGYDYDLEQAELDYLKQDPNMRDYINGVYGSLNRCFGEIENLGVLPNKRHDVQPNEVLANANTLVFDTTQVADMLEVRRVVEKGGYYDNDVDYLAEGSDIILPMLRDKSHSYTILYKPRIARVDVATAEDYEIDIPDYIASYIPYFLKGDLYRSDELAEANQSMNYFEDAMRNMLPKETSRQTVVDIVMGDFQ